MTTEEWSTKVDELTNMYKEAMEELKALKESTNPTEVSPSETATENGTKQIFVFYQEKKKKNLHWEEGRRWSSTASWTLNIEQELKISFETREMTLPKKVDFIMSHLDGPAKEEVRMYSQKERSNPDFLLDVLTRAFGEKRSSCQLLKMFYEHKQKEHFRPQGKTL